jgi:hypothetical protein
MKKLPERQPDLLAEYDLTSLKGGVRGKYYRQAKAGSNVVLIDPDVHKVFRSAKTVNTALRLVIELRKVNGAA